MPFSRSPWAGQGPTRSPPDDYARFRQNAAVFFGIETAAYDWRPEAGDLANVTVPSTVIAGVEDPLAINRAYLIESSKWLAAALNSPHREVVGGHAPYFSNPSAFVEELRIILRGLGPLG